MNEGREFRTYGNEEYNPIVQIWTALWTDKACPKCGSLMAWMLQRDTCPMCGTGKPDTTPVTLPMTADMKAQPQKKRMIEILCKCGKSDTKQIGSTRVLCGDCQKKANNIKSNAEKYKKEYYSTNSINVQVCKSCGKEIRIQEFHYKKRGGMDRICKACYVDRYGRKKREAV